MRILFADAIDKALLEPLGHRGHELIVEPSLTATDLESALGGVDVLVVRSTTVSRAAIDAADRLGLIVRAGAGTDNIDTDAASGRGIYVCNVPGRNAVAVAELTMGLLIAVDRRIPDNVADLRHDRWDKVRYSAADGLLGKTMAIIGLGAIGLAVADRAKAFGLTVTAIRRDGRPPAVASRIRTIGIRLVDTEAELLAGADIVSLHVPGSPGSPPLVDEEFLSRLRPGTILLNTARGDIVDEQALLHALDNKGIRAGIDVWPGEPRRSSASFDSPLAKHPNVVGTHHIGASTTQAQESIARGTIEVIDAYLEGHVINCINLVVERLGTCCLTIRHLDRVGVLAQVFAVLRANELNVQQMQNQVFAGGNAAVATIDVAGEPSAEVVAELQAIEEVLGAAVVPSHHAP